MLSSTSVFNINNNIKKIIEHEIHIFKLFLKAENWNYCNNITILLFLLFKCSLGEPITDLFKKHKKTY